MRELKFRVPIYYGSKFSHFLYWSNKGAAIKFEPDDVLSCDRIFLTRGVREARDSEQFTGLRDKNGLKDIYEGDIISPEGEVIANIHEGKERSGINLAITAMGCKSWRNTEQEAIKRGCFYAQ